MASQENAAPVYLQIEKRLLIMTASGAFTFRYCSDSLIVAVKFILCLRNCGLVWLSIVPLIMLDIIFDPGLVATQKDLIVAKQYATASWALAIYEYIITFDREVEVIWKRKFSVVTVLWIVNRYLLLLSYCPIILVMRCRKHVKFPGIIQIIVNISTGVTLSLRTYALYDCSSLIFAIIAPFLVMEIGIESWAVAGGTSLPLPDGMTGCILTGESNNKGFAVFWIGQLVFPTVIFLLTFGRAVGSYGLRQSFRGSILGLMLRDGIIYFVVIFCINLANVLQYLLAPPTIQAINAPFSALMTAIMICRLMLNLRSIRHNEDDGDEEYVHEVTSMSPLETYIANIGFAFAYDGNTGSRRGMGREFHSSGLMRPMEDAMYELRMLR